LVNEHKNVYRDGGVTNCGTCGCKYIELKIT
jgi:hypothetical protein